LLSGKCEEVFSHSDKLFEVGLDIPQATKLLIALKKKGFDVDCGAYTVEDALEQIKKMYEI
jgi:energy-coupling factor transport system ATP-binding protein